MAKTLLAVMAGAFLVAGVLLLTLPIAHTIHMFQPSSGLEYFDGRSGQSSAPVQTGPTAYPVNCGSALGDGPTYFSYTADSFVTDPCVEPIRNRRIAGGIALTLGAVALVAAIRIGRRSTRPGQPDRDPVTVPSPSH